MKSQEHLGDLFAQLRIDVVCDTLIEHVFDHVVSIMEAGQHRSEGDLINGRRQFACDSQVNEFFSSAHTKCATLHGHEPKKDL